MNDYGKAKKVVGIKLYLKIFLLIFFVFFGFSLFSVTKFFIKDFERGYSYSGTKYLLIVIIAELFLIFFTFGVPYLLMKLHPSIYYYDDGFSIGKNKEKVLYESMDYFFIPAYNKVNSFMGIWYKDNNNVWKYIPAINYSSKAFDLFQQDFININYPKAMKKLENNETLEFLFNNPKRQILAFRRKKYIEKKLQQALKIKVTRNSITFDDEVYEWDKYKIFVSLGTVKILDKDGNNILTLPNKALIHRVNLLESIINTLGKE